MKGDDIKMRPLGWPLVQFCRCLAAKSCPTLCDTVDYSPPDSCPWGFSRQEYWSGLPCPPPNLGLELRSVPSPAVAGESFTTGATWEAHILHVHVTVSAGRFLFPIVLDEGTDTQEPGQWRTTWNSSPWLWNVLGEAVECNVSDP